MPTGQLVKTKGFETTVTLRVTLAEPSSACIPEGTKAVTNRQNRTAKIIPAVFSALSS
jgi:hypothetical protein